MTLFTCSNDSAGLRQVPGDIARGIAEMQSLQNLDGRVGRLRQLEQHRATLENLLYSNLDILQALFRRLWREAKGEDWEDNVDREMVSSSAVELQEELGVESLFVKPIADWELKDLAKALDAPSLQAILNAKLRGSAVSENAGAIKIKSAMCTTWRNLGICPFGDSCFYAHTVEELADPRRFTKFKTTMCNKYPACPHGKNCAFAHGVEELRSPDSACLYDRFEVLVQDDVISQDDLVHKYGPAFISSHSNAAQAIQTIRFMRNILCHTKGSVRGLTSHSFNCLWDLASEAFINIATEVGEDYTKTFEKRRSKLLAESRQSPRIPECPRDLASKSLRSNTTTPLPLPSSSPNPKAISTVDVVEKASGTQFYLLC